MPKLKKHVSEFTLRLGPIQTRGPLYSIQKPKSKEGTYKYVTPEGEPVRQVYIPLEGHDGTTFFAAEDLEKAKVTDDSVLMVGKDNVAAAKKSSLPQNIMEITVHEAAEVNEQLYPSEHNAYFFEPDEKDKANVQWYVFLLEVLKRSDKAFLAIVNVKSYEGLYRLSVWRDRIVLQRQLYPESINDVAAYETEVKIPAAQIKKGITQIAKQSKPFDVEAYRNAVQAKLVELDAAVEAGDVEVISSVVASSEQPEIDMDAVLDAFDD